MVRPTWAISPSGLRTATAQLRGPRIITPSRTACPPTVIDRGSLALLLAGANTLAICRELVDEMVLVSEDEIHDAFRFLYERAKLACEPAGAVSTAALLAGKAQADPAGTTVAVVSGGNVAAQTAVAILDGE